MDSLGSGELLLILVVALFAIDPRTAGRWWGKFRRFQRKLLDVRQDFEREIHDSVAQDTPAEPAPVVRETPTERLRNWARQRVDALGFAERDTAPERLLKQLRAWPEYQSAIHIAAYFPREDELPLDSVLRGMLADGKTLWFPWLSSVPGDMGMAPVQDLEEDLITGRWETREPRLELRDAHLPDGAIVLVPGMVFDLHGNRIGRGKGYYDRWLSQRPDVIPAGLCWDVQLHPGKLPVLAHDQPMKYLITEARLVPFRPESGLPLVNQGLPEAQVSTSKSLEAPETQASEQSDRKGDEDA